MNYFELDESLVDTFAGVFTGFENLFANGEHRDLELGDAVPTHSTWDPNVKLT